MNDHVVYISYSSRDKSAVDTIAADLEHHGIKCWYSPRDLGSGELWSTTIIDAIKQAPIFLLVYTDNSNRSEHLKNEAGIAFSSGKTILPFILSDSEMNDALKYYLSGANWLNASYESMSRDILTLRETIESIIHSQGIDVPEDPVKRSKIEYRKNYKDRIIAFVDILGFKNLVDDSTTNKYDFQKILDALDDFRKLKKEKEDQDYIDDVKVTTFSDSLVISYPVESLGSDEFYSILLDLTRLQLNLLGSNVIIRGGIAIGRLRHTKDEIFGPAMNEAYLLESKEALYPRIVIREDTFMGFIKEMPQKVRKKLLGLVKQDPGEQVLYLDYLGQSELFKSAEEYKYMLEVVGSIVAHGKQIGDEKTKKKYEWLENYYKSQKK